MNRKAFTLVEVLWLITIAPFVMVIVSGIFATIIRDIPRETKVVQQNTTVLDMLRQVRHDVDGAVGLPAQFQDMRADDTTLLIQQPEAVLRYQVQDGRVVRSMLVGADLRVRPTPVSAASDQGQPQGVAPTDLPLGDERVWRMPDAVVTWRLWVRDDAAYAVEVHSHIGQWVADLRRSQLANSHVFFLHGMGKGRRTQ